MLLVLIVLSCSVDGIYSVSDEPLLKEFTVKVGDSRSDVAASMRDYEVASESDNQLSYHLRGANKLVAYEFDGELVVAMVVYVDADKYTWEELSAQFEHYTTLENVKGDMAAYVSADKTIYGELTSIIKDGVAYYSIGWSLIR